MLENEQANQNFANHIRWIHHDDLMQKSLTSLKVELYNLVYLQNKI